MKRRTVRRYDETHGEIASTFLQLGCSVADCAASEIPGFPDLVVGCMGVNHLVEGKNRATAYGRAGLNENQTAFAQEWRGEAVWEVANRDDVIALVTMWRQANAHR